MSDHAPRAAARTALEPTRATEEMMLRGVRCPLNWARAKVRLEELAVGERLVLIVDDPRAVRDIPRAAEAHGHVVVGIDERPDEWRIEIER